MKRTIISTISVVVLSTVLSGCMDKLEILPNDQIITENFFEEGSPEEIDWILSPERVVLEMKLVETVLKRHSCLTSQRPAITPGLRNYGEDPGRESVERIGF